MANNIDYKDYKKIFLLQEHIDLSEALEIWL